MGGQLAGDRLHVARGLDEHDGRLLGVEHGDHGFGRVVQDGAFGHRDAGDLVGDGFGGLAEGDEHDLVGHGASASSEFPSGVRAFSDNECFHVYQLCLSVCNGCRGTYSAALRAAANWAMAPSAEASRTSCLRSACSGARQDTVSRALA